MILLCRAEGIGIIPGARWRAAFWAVASLKPSPSKAYGRKAT